MSRRLMLRRNREDLHGYALALQQQHGIPVAASVSTYLHGELLFALLHSGAAPTCAVTGGVALQRVHQSHRWHPDLDLVMERAPGQRVVERWIETIDFSIAKAYGMKWTRLPGTRHGSAHVFLAGELAWSDDQPLCAPIPVRVLKAKKLNMEPTRIRAIHESSPLPLSGMTLNTEPLPMILARTVVSAEPDPVSAARTVYDLSILHTLHAKPSLKSFSAAIESSTETRAQIAARVRQACDYIRDASSSDAFLEPLADEISSRTFERARHVSKDLASLSVSLMDQVATRLAA